MIRSSFFVDGFNVYHAMDSVVSGKRPYRRHLWLNLKKMAATLAGSAETVTAVHYFSAYATHATWDPGKVQRHRVYVEALKSVGVDVTMGNFRRKEVRCLGTCRKMFWTYAEKETDVNIAVRLIEAAFNDEFDKAYVVTGDSDLIPALAAVKRMFPAKKVGIVIPIGRPAELLKSAADFHIKMKEHHLSTCQFDDPLVLGPGSSLQKPQTWV